MTREIIEDFRFIVIPYMVNRLKEINYEGQGGSDAKEFMSNFNEICDLAIKALEQEQKIGHCKNCKFFELNSWAACGGIPIIVAHEICKAWGEGCKTKIDGYCFLFEPKESEG